jgi:hypothetical protein
MTPGAGAEGHPRWLTWAALVAGVATAVPFWIGRYLPFLDMPQHLALATVLRHHADPAWGFAPHFEVQWGELTPYWLTYLTVHVFAQAMPVETAARVFLTLYALAFPWAGIALGRAFGQPGWVGLLAAPLALNTNLYYGFVNYAAGVVLLLFAIAAFQRQLEEPQRGRAVGLAVLAIALFFAHVQALALLLVCAPVQALARRAAWRRALRASISLVPAVAGLLAPWAYWTFVDPQGSERQFASIQGDPTPRFESLATNLEELPASVAGAFQDGSDGLVFAAWAVVAVVGLSRGWRPGEPFRGRLVPALLAATALLGYFLAPMSIKGQWNINPRFALPAALLVLPALRFASPRRAGAAALALSLTVAANAAWHHAAFDREVGPFEEALASLPRGRRVLALMYEPRGHVLEKWPYLHFGQYAMVRRGGAAGGSFAASAPMPVRYRDVKSFPHPGPWRPGDFDPAVHGPCYDYVLVRWTSGGRPPAAGPSGLREPVFSQGPWRLYRSPGTAAAKNGGAARREDGPSPGFRPGRGGGS